MAKAVPIFRESSDVSFTADACQPLVEAASRGDVRLKALQHGHYPGRRFPAGVLPGIKMVGYWHAETDQDWGLPWHRNEGVEFTFLESGRLGFAVDDQEFCLQPDDMTFTRPWQKHRVGSPNVSASRLVWFILDVGVRRPDQPWKWPPWIILSPSDLAELTNILRHNEQPVWKANPDIRRCFQAIAHGVETDRGGGNVSLLTLRINDFLLRTLELLRRKKVRLDQTLSSTRRTVELFLNDLRTHPEHLALPWTLDEMANSCGLGVTQFVHHVKSLTNMPPMHFLNQCRLERAAALLRNDGGLSVTDVALACGFSSSQYFSTVFARRYGLSPRDSRTPGAPRRAFQDSGAQTASERGGATQDPATRVERLPVQR